MTRVCQLSLAGLMIVVFAVAQSAVALEPESARRAPTPVANPVPKAEVKAAAKEKADTALKAGAKFLLKNQQDDGSWGGKFGPAVTAMAVKSLVQAGEAADSPAVDKAIKFVLASQVKDGKMKGAFAAQELANYNTAICVSMLVAINKDKKYDDAVKAALDFLRRDQWDENESIDNKDPRYGGFGYGGGQRPDMSNTNTTMDALKSLVDAGLLKQDDPMFEKVRVFVANSQNRSESNKVGTFAVGDDGGFIYTPAESPTQGGPQTKVKDGATSRPDGKSSLASYGSMTYAGFKSFLYSGLKMDDPRVKDALKWIERNYRLDENPGVGSEGLYYYYHTMARALAASGQATIKDKANVAHDWRAEMIDKLVSLQKTDGSWVNEKAARWEEGNPVLATCFAMLTLEEIVK